MRQVKMILSLWLTMLLLFHREVWVQSSKPYPISLTLKQLQDLLQDKQGIDNSTFNMAVRVIATDELQLFNDNPHHYMDLQFCVSFFPAQATRQPHITAFNIVLIKLSFISEHSDRLHERP